MKYRDKYGAWAGQPYGRKPDFTKCAESVCGNGRGEIPHQCRSKAKFDPDENGNPTTCRIHSEAYVAEKRRVAREKHEAAMAKNRIKWNANKFHAALVEIAAGHNDPRALAAEVLARLES